MSAKQRPTRPAPRTKAEIIASYENRLGTAIYVRDMTLYALRDAIEMLDDLRLDYRRRFAIEEQKWLAARVKRLDEIRKIAGMP